MAVQKATVANLYTYIGDRINDPSGTEVDTGAASTMLEWINRVVGEAAQLTDCLQSSGTVTGDGTAEDFVVSGLTNMWRVISVTDKTNGIVYHPLDRSAYQSIRNSIVIDGVTGQYYYSVFGYDAANQKISLLPVVENSVNITIEHSEIPETLLTTDTPPGLLAYYSELIVAGVAKIYFDASGDAERAEQEFQQYIMWINRLNKEVGINPEIKPEMSSLYRMAALLNQGGK